jgi:hypothetical protein
MKFFFPKRGEVDCAQHGLGDEFSSENCPNACECCQIDMADGWGGSYG